ncbi:DNA segregation ATPase FtsK/SpoIIIE, S-DNA-T family, partial [Lachnospiraceae bacterium C7]
ARKLSAIEHEEGISSRIPESVTFFDMYKVKKSHQANCMKHAKK